MYISKMYTPRRPVKRVLFPYSPASTPKRARTGTFRAGAQTGRFRFLNKRTQTGPRTNGTLTQQVKALQRFVKTLAPEVKYIDNTLFQTDIPATGAVVHVSAVAQGDTQGTRTGNTINVTGVDLSGNFIRISTDFAGAAFLRVALVQDREQVADTAPSVANIFATGDPVNALPNLDTLERFRILWLSPVMDAWQMVLDSDRLVAGSVPTHKGTYSHSWKGNIKVSFNGTASTDIQKNGLYFCYLTSSGVTTFDANGFARLCYTDV